MRKVLEALGREHVFSSGALAEFETILSTVGVPQSQPANHALEAPVAVVPGDADDNQDSTAFDSYRWDAKLCVCLSQQTSALKKCDCDCMGWWRHLLSFATTICGQCHTDHFTSRRLSKPSA